MSFMSPQPRVANAQAWVVAAQLVFAVLIFAWLDSATDRSASSLLALPH
jgi:hypothetical protein